MCFHNSVNVTAKKLAARYGRKTRIIEVYKEIMTEKYHISAFTHPHYPIITHAEEIQNYAWGLIPHFIKAKNNTENAVRKAMEDAKKISNMTLNARAETIFEKPSYREPIRGKRCLIPSTGYFEYHHNLDGSTTPYYIFLKNEPVFSMAGIYDNWENPETGEDEQTFSMITTEANELTAKIHNGGKNPHRMPLILKKEDEEKWLNPDLSEEEIELLMKPYPANLMDAHKIRNDFIKMNPSDPDIIKPLG